MAFLERLGALPGKDLAEEGVRVGQRHDEVGDLRLLPVQAERRFPKVGLRLTRPVGQRHEDFRRGLPPLPNGLLDRRQPAGVAVFVTEPLEDPAGRVPLFRRRLSIRLQNLVKATEPADR